MLRNAYYILRNVYGLNAYVQRVRSECAAHAGYMHRSISHAQVIYRAV